MLYSSNIWVPNEFNFEHLRLRCLRDIQMDMKRSRLDVWVCRSPEIFQLEIVFGESTESLKSKVWIRLPPEKTDSINKTARKWCLRTATFFITLGNAVKASVLKLWWCCWKRSREEFMKAMIREQCWALRHEYYFPSMWGYDGQFNLEERAWAKSQKHKVKWYIWRITSKPFMAAV